MIKSTRWSPDTCECVLEYTWDDQTSEDQRTHTVSNVIKKCTAHNPTDMQTHHAVVLEENQRKNKFLGHVIETFPALVNTDTQGNAVLKDGVVQWSFDSKRVLNITLSGISPTQKGVAQNLADTKLGNGKVKVT